MISTFIRGKHKPGYTQNSFANGDKCIIVNMGDPLFTGRKRQQKVYRHHTGYPGGLKEYTFKQIMEKDPERILRDSLMGMLPKNSLRKQMIKENVIMFTEPHHTFTSILPQFTEPLPTNINDEIGLGNFSAENTTVKFSSDGTIPEEFKDFPQDLDDTIDYPLNLRQKTHTQDRENFKLGIALRKSYKGNKRYKQHR